MLNWIARNRTVLTSKLCTYAELNYLKSNCLTFNSRYCRIHWLQLCRGVRHPPNSVLDMMLYTHLPYHNDSIRVKTDARRKINAWRKTQEWRTHEELWCRKEDTRRLLFKYSPLTLLQRFERVVEGLHVRGWWRLNINFIFWPHCYDPHIVWFLFSWCWGPLHRGFPRAPSVGCGLPYHIWSLLSGSLLATASGVFRVPPRSGVAFPTTSGFYCLEVCWQLLWDPNSTELNNNSTPTLSPTGSLKSNV